MSLLSSWGEKEDRNLVEETSTSRLQRLITQIKVKYCILFYVYRLKESELSLLLFDSLQAVIYCVVLLLSVFIVCCVKGEITAVRNILRVKNSLLNAKLFGFEGADVYEKISNVVVDVNEVVL